GRTGAGVLAAVFAAGTELAGGTAAGGGGTAAGTVYEGRGWLVGITVLGAGGGTATGFAGVATAGRATTGAEAAGFSIVGGAAGRDGAAGAEADDCCFPRIAFRTSPGLEMLDKSILGLMPSASPRLGRALFAEADSARRYTRTFSASCSSRELECVFFSVTPISGSESRIDLLLTSNSRARSLIRTLLIRPRFSPNCPVTSSSEPHGISYSLPVARHKLTLVLGRSRRFFRLCRFFRNFFSLLRGSCDFFHDGFFPACSFFNRDVCRRFFSSSFVGSRFLRFFRGYTFQTGEVIIDRQADFFHRLRPDSFYGLKLFGRHVGQRLDRGNTSRT